VAVKIVPLFLIVLLENTRELCKLLPTIDTNYARGVVRLDNVCKNGCYNENDSSNLCELEEKVICMSALVSTIICFLTTCDGAGKSVFTGLLENNRYYDKHSGNK
jgi:hypothetical protein